MEPLGSSVSEDVEHTAAILEDFARRLRAGEEVVFLFSGVQEDAIGTSFAGKADVLNMLVIAAAARLFEVQSAQLN